MSLDSMMTTTEEIRGKIVERASEDTEFRAEFVADPKGVIQPRIRP